MSVRNRTAAWIASVLTLGVAAVGCATYPAAEAHDRAALHAALEAVRTAHCPATPPDVLINDGGGLEPLVANRLLLCGYVHGSAATTAQALVTDKAVLNRLRTSLNKLGEPPIGRVNCPADTGAKVLEIFGDGRHVAELVGKLSGCQVVSNGNFDGWVGNSDAGTTVMGLLPTGFCRAVWRAAPCDRGAAAPGPR
ncbi:hypothetical protein [Streptomyces violascens]|uniref:Lipoprotein n=1 Tax=Streptomyces violascens TaxID=67381 RepID=A0ABQ3QU47_9ACTN|nr:hypothetical protein [Streptomyces violascens]GGU06668.1 hypothetical protein GCM10010289_29890 [Streptomyces violascens]GHI40809.1 hypothetical protein Sviol_52170 [Streptomyces violascens]